VYRGIAELASCGESSVVRTHAAGDEHLGSSFEVELHLLRHLALDGGGAEDGANPIANAM
jgi:hypothetical protein